MSEEISVVRVTVGKGQVIKFRSVRDTLIFAAAFSNYSGFRGAWTQVHQGKICSHEDYKHYKSLGDEQTLLELTKNTYFEDGRLLYDALYDKLKGGRR